jgi:hypothetical protein
MAKGYPSTLGAVTTSGLTVAQTKALDTLAAGGSYVAAAKAAGHSWETVRQWGESPAFKTELEKRVQESRETLARQRAELAKSLMATALVGSAKLKAHAASKDAKRSLSASKAAVAAGVALVRGDDTGNAQPAPMFSLPVGATISLAVETMPLPPTDASVVVDDVVDAALADPPEQT